MKIKNFSIVIFIIMLSGYYFRLMRAKSLSKIYDKETVKKMIDNGYFCWYFLG